MSRYKYCLTDRLEAKNCNYSYITQISRKPLFFQLKWSAGISLCSWNNFVLHVGLYITPWHPQHSLETNVFAQIRCERVMIPFTPFFWRSLSSGSIVTVLLILATWLAVRNVIIRWIEMTFCSFLRGSVWHQNIPRLYQLQKVHNSREIALLDLKIPLF